MRNAIVFLDSGDTLVDESTEVRIKGDVVDHAEFFPGIKEVLFQLKNAGFRVALVALRQNRRNRQDQDQRKSKLL